MFAHNNNFYDTAFEALIRPLSRNSRKIARMSNPQRRLISQRARESLPLVRESDFAENLMSGFDEDFDNHFSLIRPASFNYDLGNPFEEPRSIWQDFNKRSNLKEEADKYVIELNEPGITDESLNINFSEKDNAISLQAKQEIINDSEGFLSTSYSSYENNYSLGEPIDFSGITREVDGEKILITVPKINANEVENSKITEQKIEDGEANSETEEK